MAIMSKHKTFEEAELREVLAEMLRRRDEWLVDDIYASGKPVTLEMRKQMGWPLSAEEALERMRENKRKQEEAERQSKS
jgi:hypothetical protein